MRFDWRIRDLATTLYLPRCKSQTYSLENNLHGPTLKAAFHTALGRNFFERFLVFRAKGVDYQGSPG